MVEDKLYLSEERYRSIVELAWGTIWTATPSGDDIEVPAWRELTGQTPEEARNNWAPPCIPRIATESWAPGRIS